MVLSRRQNLKKVLCSLSILLVSCGLTFAAKVPELKGRVNDYANIISNGTEEKLTAYLKDLDEQQGVQIAVLTVPSIEGDDIASYSMKVAEKWKLGDAKTDKGALLVVAYQEHSLRIEVGYGLEDKLTDAKCGLIIRNVIIPQFKDGDYSEGILLGVQNMGGIATDNAELVSRSVQNADEESEDIAGMIFMFIAFLFFIALISSKGGIWKWILLSNLTGGHRYGGYRGFSSGSSHHSSGFGGSGFGGFSGGGGHFGGGGASGHW
ncbi:MAG: TPM domain-containing protein [Treponema sp.]|nr:TPM domain-containing protein [Treponema sp.]